MQVGFRGGRRVKRVVRHVTVSCFERCLVIKKVPRTMTGFMRAQSFGGISHIGQRVLALCHGSVRGCTSACMFGIARVFSAVPSRLRGRRGGFVLGTLARKTEVQSCRATFF